jgi:hypothetical protein
MGGEVDGMSPWRDRVPAERNRASLSGAVRQRGRRRSLDQVIKIVEESNLAPEEQKVEVVQKATELRGLLLFLKPTEPWPADMNMVSRRAGSGSSGLPLPECGEKVASVTVHLLTLCGVS